MEWCASPTLQTSSTTMSDTQKKESAMAYAPHYYEIRQVLAKHQNEWKNELLCDLSTAIETAIKEREREVWEEVKENYDKWGTLALPDLKQILHIGP